MITVHWREREDFRGKDKDSTLGVAALGGGGPPPNMTCCEANCFCNSWWSDGACSPHHVQQKNKIRRETSKAKENSTLHAKTAHVYSLPWIWKLCILRIILAFSGHKETLQLATHEKTKWEIIIDKVKAENTFSVISSAFWYSSLWGSCTKKNKQNRHTSVINFLTVKMTFLCRINSRGIQFQ